MKFDEFLTYLTIKGVVGEPLLVDVSPLGVQYRLIVEHLSLKGSIYYREINSNRIMVKNVLIAKGSGFLRDLSSQELLEILT